MTANDLIKQASIETARVAAFQEVKEAQTEYDIAVEWELPTSEIVVLDRTLREAKSVLQFTQVASDFWFRTIH